MPLPSGRPLHPHVSDPLEDIGLRFPGELHRLVLLLERLSPPLRFMQSPCPILGTRFGCASDVEVLHVLRDGLRAGLLVTLDGLILA